LNEEITWIRCDDKASLDFDLLLSGRKIGERITEVKIDRKEPFIDLNVYDELIGFKVCNTKILQNEFFLKQYFYLFV
jgi:hypothetical protein